jgi:hypothetical protein
VQEVGIALIVGIPLGCLVVVVAAVAVAQVVGSYCHTT